MFVEMEAQYALVHSRTGLFIYIEAKPCFIYCRNTYSLQSIIERITEREIDLHPETRNAPSSLGGGWAEVQGQICRQSPESLQALPWDFIAALGDMSLYEFVVCCAVSIPSKLPMLCREKAERS